MVGKSEGIQGMKDIPYLVHESQMARMERIIKRLFVLCVILIVLLFGTNAGWIWYESHFEDVETTVTQELDSGEGGDAIINDGVHINSEEVNGESKTDGDNTPQGSEK